MEVKRNTFVENGLKTLTVYCAVLHLLLFCRSTNNAVFYDVLTTRLNHIDINVSI